MSQSLLYNSILSQQCSDSDGRKGSDPPWCSGPSWCLRPVLQFGHIMYFDTGWASGPSAEQLGLGALLKYSKTLDPNWLFSVRLLIHGPFITERKLCIMWEWPSITLVLSPLYERGVASFDSFPQHGVGSSDFSTSFTSVLLYQDNQLLYSMVLSKGLTLTVWKGVSIKGSTTG